MADDVEHRLPPRKLAKVIEAAASLFGGDDLEVEIEHEDCSITQFPVLSAEVAEGALIFRLGEKHTDCLAKDVCLPGSGSGCC